MHDTGIRVFKGQTDISGGSWGGILSRETSALALEKGARIGVGDCLSLPEGSGVFFIPYLICQSPWQWPQPGQRCGDMSVNSKA